MHALRWVTSELQNIIHTREQGTDLDLLIEKCDARAASSWKLRRFGRITLRAVDEEVYNKMSCWCGANENIMTEANLKPDCIC